MGERLVARLVIVSNRVALPGEKRAGGLAVAVKAALRGRQTRRSTIIFLISAIALAGFRPFGQAWVQFMIVWQR